jgi:hypothetical protein
MPHTPASSTTEISSQKTPVKLISSLISYLLHPIFIPIFIIYYLLWIHPDSFVGFSERIKWQTLVIVVVNMVVFPLITVLLLKALGFISSIHMRERKDRIIPYIACGIFFFWGYTVFKEQSMYPLEWVAFVLGSFIAVSAALIANIYFKISMHAMGIGGCLGFMLLLMLHDQDALLILPFIAVTLCTGLVASARLHLQSHTPFEIYTGILLGLVSQIVGYYVVFN